jgi:NAD+ synthase
MRDYKQEAEKRVEFIRAALNAAGSDGIVFGNSGGKDAALAGILCKMACKNTLGLIMPCSTKSNYESDKTDAEALAKQFNIESRIIDLTSVKSELCRAVGEIAELNDIAANIAMAPRLRMTALYAVSNSENRLVAGTGNRSEIYMGYFTKWGDGAYDFNPISDLTVTEIYEFLRYFNAPESIIGKTPSGGLFDGQTDESEMGVSYNNIDEFLLSGVIPDEEAMQKIENFHKTTEHKRRMPATFRDYMQC